MTAVKRPVEITESTVRIIDKAEWRACREQPGRIKGRPYIKERLYTHGVRQDVLEAAELEPFGEYRLIKVVTKEGPTDLLTYMRTKSVPGGRQLFL
jgi:hypothetical protein